MVQCSHSSEMINALRNIIGKKVYRLFLIVWPPYGEQDLSQLDISAGYVLEDNLNEVVIITTDKNDLTTPLIETKPVPQKYFSWNDFKPRIRDWIRCVEGMELEMEFYEVSSTELFEKVVGHRINHVELIEVENNQPIGVKLVFNEDFVSSTPIEDGNTIETSRFNGNQNLQNFKVLGEIKFKRIEDGKA